MRPASIATFERLYLVSLILGLVIAGLSLDHSAQVLSANPAAAKLGLGMGAVIAANLALVGLLLLLWHKAAHRASNVARWLLVAETALEAINLPSGLHGIMGLGVMAALAVAALKLASVAFLFRGDARQWFAAAKSTHAAD